MIFAREVHYAGWGIGVGGVFYRYRIAGAFTLAFCRIAIFSDGGDEHKGQLCNERRQTEPPSIRIEKAISSVCVVGQTYRLACYNASTQRPLRCLRCW